MGRMVTEWLVIMEEGPGFDSTGGRGGLSVWSSPHVTIGFPYHQK